MIGRGALRRLLRSIVLLGSMVMAMPDANAGCELESRDISARDTGTDGILAFLEERGKRVLTFTGYSAAGYEDPIAMLEHAAAALDRHDPHATLVNIGATEDGIGAVYALAKQRGFATMGIVSTLAREHRVALSPCVDHVFYVKDEAWGGMLAGTTMLSPTSAAIVAVSDEIVGIGGGDIARDEMLAARAAGISVTFIPADLNHDLARAKAAERGDPPPGDYRGSAHEALAGKD